jgi:hypothetical protein
MPMRPCWVEIRTRALEDNFRFLSAWPRPMRSCWPLSRPTPTATRSAFALRPWCAPGAVAGRHQRGRGRGRARALPRAAGSGHRRRLSRPGRGGAAAQPDRRGLGAWQLDELEAAAHAAGAPAGSVPRSSGDRYRHEPPGRGPDALAPLLARFAPESPLRLEGVMTHLFAADEADGAVTEEQLARLDEALGRHCGRRHLCRVAQCGQLRRAAGRPGGDCRFGRPPRNAGDDAAGPGALRPDPALRSAIRASLPADADRGAGRLATGAQWKTRVTGVRSRFPPARWWAITEPLWPPSRCGWRCWPRATPTASTAGSATASACSSAASARPWWAASAWTRRCST